MFKFEYEKTAEKTKFSIKLFYLEWLGFLYFDE